MPDPISNHTVKQIIDLFTALTTEKKFTTGYKISVEFEAELILKSFK